MTTKQYQPKTGEACGCRPGPERDNCGQCEGTGQRIDFKAIRNRSLTTNQNKATARPWHLQNETCIASGDKFIAQTMVDDDDAGLKTLEQAELDAALIVHAVNEREALLAVAERQERAIKLAIVNLNLAKRLDAPRGSNGYVTNAINGLEAALRVGGAN